MQYLMNPIKDKVSVFPTAWDSFALRFSVVWRIRCPSQVELCFRGLLTFTPPPLSSFVFLSCFLSSLCLWSSWALWGWVMPGALIGPLMKAWLQSEREKKQQWWVRGSRLGLRSFAPAVSDARSRTHRLHCSYKHTDIFLSLIFCLSLTLSLSALPHSTQASSASREESTRLKF